ncbi:MAG: hypothetical protein NTW87_09470 [Planctomycetota bacterium]|nr:hypothetical protein [Planctomycetota bacterium]
MPEEDAPSQSGAVASADTAKERKFPCKQCGADLVFEPGQKELKCPYCGHEEKIPQTEAEIKEYSFNDYLAKPRGRGYGQTGGRDVRCGGCGAVTHFDASMRATTCAFCGGPLVTEDGAGDGAGEDVIAPEALVPFAITAAQAQERFRQWIASLWFAPSQLKRGSSLRQLQGVYRPFWTYDAHTVSHWTGERGDYYYTTETYTVYENGKAVTKTRQVRHTRWTYVSGVYSEFFDDVLISAGRNTDFNTTYQLGGLKPYAKEYLSGFAAERYVVACEAGWNSAKEIIAGEIYSAVRNQIGGDEQRVTSVNTAYSGVTYKHILLPLWISSYRYGTKTYSFQVNGQTGAVCGARPYSFWKIFFLVVSILAAMAIIALLVSNTQAH